MSKRPNDADKTCPYLNLELIHIRRKVGNDDLVSGLLSRSRWDRFRAIGGGNRTSTRRGWSSRRPKNLRLAGVPARVGTADATGASSDDLPSNVGRVGGWDKERDVPHPKTCPWLDSLLVKLTACSGCETGSTTRRTWQRGDSG